MEAALTGADAGAMTGAAMTVIGFIAMAAGERTCAMGEAAGEAMKDGAGLTTLSARCGDGNETDGAAQCQPTHARGEDTPATAKSGPMSTPKSSTNGSYSGSSDASDSVDEHSESRRRHRLVQEREQTHRHRSTRRRRRARPGTDRRRTLSSRQRAPEIAEDAPVAASMRISAESTVGSGAAMIVGATKTESERGAAWAAVMESVRRVSAASERGTTDLEPRRAGPCTRPSARSRQRGGPGRVRGARA